MADTEQVLNPLTGNFDIVALTIDAQAGFGSPEGSVVSRGAPDFYLDGTTLYFNPVAGAITGWQLVQSQPG